MKKILFLLVVLSAMSVNTLADGLTATLQQGDNMQAFYGADAFKQAYEAAESNGAIITLSSGSFNSVESIEKSISVIGAYGLYEYDSRKTGMSKMDIKADNVKIEGIRIGEVKLGKILNCHIKRCYLTTLNATATHTNTIINQCLVENDYAIGTGVNYVIQNSSICYFFSMNSMANKATITNCVIQRWYSSYNGAIQPVAIYLNNVLGGYNKSNTSYTCNANSEFYFNYFIKTYSSANSFTIKYPNGCINEGNMMGDYYSWSASLLPKQDWGINGMDGTVVGIKGGSGFSEMPSIPRVTSSIIDSHTDSQGKINVKISATVGAN